MKYITILWSFRYSKSMQIPIHIQLNLIKYHEITWHYRSCLVSVGWTHPVGWTSRFLNMYPYGWNEWSFNTNQNPRVQWTLGVQPRFLQGSVTIRGSLSIIPFLEIYPWNNPKLGIVYIGFTSLYMIKFSSSVTPTPFDIFERTSSE